MKVTGKLLKEQGACNSQRRKFTRLFGKSATVNIKNIKRAAKFDMSAWWAGDHLLTAKQRERFEKIDGKFNDRISKTNPYGNDVNWSEIAWASFAVAAGVAKLKPGKKTGFDAIEKA